MIPRRRDRARVQIALLILVPILKIDTFARHNPPSSLRLTDKTNQGKAKGPAGPPKWEHKSKLKIVENKSKNNVYRIEQSKYLNTALQSNVVEKENILTQNVKGL
ncbi:unnamed protein product [Lepeophtheirus salmonis]|uniref:(salmon louse) hypothetical protein n=1 Tax=Lepeophtheirus salmonis TaxID=72036 RepID=A0A7R8CIB9_LEPSM|nr:unnamed protein product [Lepeophtheirus salmonis]CAF2829471.1 unnamed protein product [Lepeophtheirus salmonis]